MMILFHNQLRVHRASTLDTRVSNHTVTLGVHFIIDRDGLGSLILVLINSSPHVLLLDPRVLLDGITKIHDFNTLLVRLSLVDILIHLGVEATILIFCGQGHLVVLGCGHRLTRNSSIEIFIQVQLDLVILCGQRKGRGRLDLRLAAALASLVLLTHALLLSYSLGLFEGSVQHHLHLDVYTLKGERELNTFCFLRGERVVDKVIETVGLNVLQERRRGAGVGDGTVAEDMADLGVDPTEDLTGMRDS